MGLKDRIRAGLEELAVQGALAVKEEDLLLLYDVSYGTYYNIKRILVGKRVLIPVKQGRRTLYYTINWSNAAALFPESTTIAEMAQTQDVERAKLILKASKTPQTEVNP